MPRWIWAVLLLCCASGAWAATGANSANSVETSIKELPIIPKPVQQHMGQGSFMLTASTRIFVSDETGLLNAQILNASLQKRLGFRLKIRFAQASPNETNFIAFSTVADSRNAEQYTLRISSKAIKIAGADSGQFYGMQSLLQLLPADMQNAQYTQNMQHTPAIPVPVAEISDGPRFPWRGMHLDVGRHLVNTDFIKKFLDQMAFYKMNVFHWHLTEDQGWRIEIKAYPKLTQVGGWRKESTLGHHVRPYIGDGKPYGGFYSQEQIKDIVAYAAARHITVVPEIELPGHSTAALAAYPELACTSGPFQVATNWGIFDDIYCPTETTFQFLEKVLNEVMALFPGKYIHIGGDEVPKKRWKQSPRAQTIMRREGLNSEEELQSWFIGRVERIINRKGKHIIGWDEILQGGGLARDATVMSWRGEEGGITAAREGHDVIMSPVSHCYFDAGQGPKEQESWGLGGQLSLEKVYAYNPVPTALTPKEQTHVRGVQGNIWTEYLKTPEMIEYMTYPRMLAMAEVAWSEQSARQFASFEQRLSVHYAFLEQARVAYRLPRPQGLDGDVTTNENSYTLKLQPTVPGSSLYYTLDGNTPDIHSSLYREPVKIKLTPGQPVNIQVLTVSSGGRYSAVQRASVVQQTTVGK